MTNKKENRSKLLSSWLNKKKAKKEGIPPVKKMENGPLSFGQERLYFLQTLSPDSAFYHYAEHYKFKGLLEIDRIISSLVKAIECFPILKSGIETSEAGIVQVFHPERKIEITRRNIPVLQQEQFISLARAEASRGFNLQSDSLVRLVFVERSDSQLEVLVIMHHIVTDKWSMEILRKLWVKLYSEEEYSYSEQKSYFTYASEQRKSQFSVSSLNYWQELLDNHTKIELDFVKQVPAERKYTGAFHRATIDSQTCKRVREYCKTESISPYSYYLSIFLLQLQKHSQEHKICIGTPISTRTSESLQEMIGFFNETMIIHQDFTGISNFRNLVEAVAKQFLTNLQHIEVPFEKIVSIVSNERTRDENPLFSHMFLYHNKQNPPPFHEAFDYSFETFDLGVAKFDITLYIAESKENTELIIEYSDELFYHKNIEEFAKHFQNLLQQCTTDSLKNLSEISLLNKVQISEIKAMGQGLNINWNFSSVIDTILIHCRESKDKTALTDGIDRICYEELEQQSKKISAVLQNHGLRNKGIGLYCQAGVTQILGIIGILRSGNFYVPLDPKYPKNRIQYYIEQATLDIILHDSIETSLLFNFSGEKYSIEELINKDSELSSYSDVKISPEDSAYMIFTSGSSGKPKGVLVSHKTLAHSTDARREYYPNQPESFLLLSSFAFDSSVAGIFWTLTNGGKLVLTKSRAEQDMEALSELLLTEKVTHTLLLPSLYSVILSLTQESRLKHLNTVIVAGEATNERLVELHMSTVASARLYNEYGPTEGTVWASVAELSDKNSEITIGKPIMNTSIYLIKSKQLVGHGHIGEIYIGGNNVVGSYFNNSGLSKKMFIFLPSISDDILYRTGDLGKWNDEGELVILGRKDQQIKLRGHRIELGEIQSALLKHDSVQECEVRVLDESSPQIIVFYRGQKKINLAELIEDELPEFMIPSKFIHVKEFPLLPNGKLDENQLRNHRQSASKPNLTHTHSTSEEKAMLEVWKKVLGLDEIAIDDNFFRIGGDSMTSIKLLAEGRKHGLLWKPQDIFIHQTIRELTQHTNKAKLSAPKGRYTGSAKFLPIHSWFFRTHHNAPYHWGHSYIIHFNRIIDIDELQAVMNHLAEQHPELGANFNHELEEFSFNPVNITVSQIERVNVQKHMAVTSEDWAKNPSQTLLKAFLINEKTSSICLYCHHLLVDKYSWDILLEEIKELILLQSEGKALPVTIKTNSILDWSDFLVKTTKNHDFWQEFIQVNTSNGEKSSSIFLENEFETCTLEITIPQKEGNHLPYNLAIQEILLGYLSLAIQNIEGNRAIIFELEHNGRSHSKSTLDLSKAIGWFSSVYPIKIPAKEETQSKNYWLEFKKTLQSIEENGLEFGLILQNERLEEECRSHEWILFNYMGETQTNSTIEFLEEGVRSPFSERTRLMEVVVYKKADRYTYNMSYHAKSFSKARINQLLKELVIVNNSFLEEQIGQELDLQGYDDVELSQDSLDHLNDLF